MKLHYEVEGGEFLAAGNASSQFKKVLKQIGIPTDIIRKVSVAMYEAEINMVIHANGGGIDAEINEKEIHVLLVDQGPGIPDIDLAMKPGYSTASKQAREMGFGAGMGLANIKRYSDFLKITTTVGVGTTVEISFQLAS